MYTQVKTLSELLLKINLLINQTSGLFFLLLLSLFTNIYKKNNLYIYIFMNGNKRKRVYKLTHA